MMTLIGFGYLLPLIIVLIMFFGSLYKERREGFGSSFSRGDFLWIFILTFIPGVNIFLCVGVFWFLIEEYYKNHLEDWLDEPLWEKTTKNDDDIVV
jgi:hypothetical protein